MSPSTTSAPPCPFSLPLSRHSYEDQITVLLGHNGAGKSTLINVLTGMYAPTEGDALVYGKSLVNQLGDVRKNLGVCFQQNLMMKVLTVGEAARR